MNKSPLNSVLIGVLLLSAVSVLALTYLNIQATRKARAMQAVTANINNTRLIMDALAKEAVAYGQTNRAIDPILISVGLKEGAAAGKPATR